MFADKFCVKGELQYCPFKGKRHDFYSTQHTHQKLRIRCANSIFSSKCTGRETPCQRNLSESTVAPPLKEQQTQIGDKCIAARSQAGEMAAKTGQMPAHAENATALAQTTENISKQILTAARKVETTSKGQAERKAGQKMENNAKSAYSSSNSKPASGAILDQAV